MEFVKLNDISVKNTYLRLDTDVSDLEKSIHALGLLSPLVIDSDNLLLAGGRRYTALKNLGHEKVWVKRTKGDALEKELVSIDENLVRKDLEKVELEANLRRAKELYTELLNKQKGKALEVAKEIEAMEESEKPVVPDSSGDGQKEALPEVEVLASQKFVKDVSEKTGMSHRQIFQAIERDEKASSDIKGARVRGEISIGHTNEVIKLPKKDQKHMLPLIKDKTVREVRSLVKEAKSQGIDAVLERCSKERKYSKEAKNLQKLFKKASQILGGLELEGISLDDESLTDLKKDWEKTHSLMSKLLKDEEGFSPNIGFSPNQNHIEENPNAYQ